MRKIALILCVALVLSFTGCGDNNNNASQDALASENEALQNTTTVPITASEVATTFAPTTTEEITELPTTTEEITTEKPTETLTTAESIAEVLDDTPLDVREEIQNMVFDIIFICDSYFTKNEIDSKTAYDKVSDLSDKLSDNFSDKNTDEASIIEAAVVVSAYLLLLDFVINFGGDELSARKDALEKTIILTELFGRCV